MVFLVTVGYDGALHREWTSSVVTRTTMCSGGLVGMVTLLFFWGGWWRYRVGSNRVLALIHVDVVMVEVFRLVVATRSTTDE